LAAVAGGKENQTAIAGNCFMLGGALPERWRRSPNSPAPAFLPAQRRRTEQLARVEQRFALAVPSDIERFFGCRTKPTRCCD
jgi:hypothetical protein